MTLRKELIQSKTYLTMNQHQQQEKLFQFKPMDITNTWIEDSIAEIMYRYSKKIDPKDRKLLLLFRLLGVKYRVHHTLKSCFKNQLVIEEELKVLLDVFVLESGFGFLTKEDLLALQ